MLLLAGVCIPLGVQAQAPKKVSIEGTVTEYNTKEPIAGCVVFRNLCNHEDCKV